MVPPATWCRLRPRDFDWGWPLTQPKDRGGLARLTSGCWSSSTRAYGFAVASVPLLKFPPAQRLRAGLLSSCCSCCPRAVGVRTARQRWNQQLSGLWTGSSLEPGPSGYPFALLRIDPDSPFPITSLGKRREGVSMPWYRLYVRDREGHFSAVREFEADDEAQAISRADRLSSGLTCELWHDQNLLRRWDEQPDGDAFGAARRRLDGS